MRDWSPYRAPGAEEEKVDVRVDLGYCQWQPIGTEKHNLTWETMVK